MNRRNVLRLGIAVACVSFLSFATGFSAGNLQAQEVGWSPKLEKTEIFTGRQLEWFTHGSKPEWKAVNPAQKDTFAVMHPKTEVKPEESRPLYVVLHSAGHDVNSCLECTKTVGNHDIYRAPDDFYALYLDCRANQATDWWWGGLSAQEMPNAGNAHKAGFALSPCEKRVMDTVAWTIQKYGIDVNRVYLCGNSMGGSGTLGIGLRHGDVFAAIKANVPAGVLHAATRVGFMDEKGEIIPWENAPFAQLPEPPVCIDYSAPNDSWSHGHEILFDGMKRCRYALVAYWGNFGHANNTQNICTVNDLIDTLAWTEIRKNTAYPVFTNAACDNVIPWPEREKATEPGQVNTFFRWENGTDSAEKLQITLWMVTDEELGSKIFTAPKETVTDVSVRRLQNFRVAPNQKVKWTYGTQSGTVTADKNGLVTITGLKMTQEKVVLELKK